MVVNEIPDAVEITISPKDEGVIVSMAPMVVLRSLLNKVISRGDIVNVNDLRKQRLSNPSFDEFFGTKSEDFFPAPTAFYMLVADTKPAGKVKVVENTSIKVLSEFPNPDGIPKSKIINVKEKPDIKGKKEVNDIEDIRTIANAGQFIHRYEDKKEIIFFVSDYYFIKKK